MSAKLLDGKSLAAKILARCKRDLAGLHFTPTLAAVIVGDDPASHQYVKLKEKACRDVGIHFERLSFAADASMPMLVRVIEHLNGRLDVDGILVQLPLPDGLDENVVIHAIDPEKDVDGFHPDNTDGLSHGRPRLIPGLAAGILALIRASGLELAGKSAVVIAKSREFYAPLSVVLSSAGLRTIHVRPDEDVAAATFSADVVVVAVGRANFLKGTMLKTGCVVIDVGTNRLDGKTVGDADPSVRDVAGFLSPVPGGVGPMTVAMLMKNVIDLAAKRRGQ